MNNRNLIYQAYEASWKIENEIRRVIWSPLIRLYFWRQGIKWSDKWRIYGFPLIQKYRGSHIQIGDHFQMRNWFETNPLGLRHRSILSTRSRDAVIQIGKGVGMSGAVICAQARIDVGNHVRLGANSVIVDTDFHPLQAQERLLNPRKGNSHPVMIEDHVLIGMNATILKGAHIGQGTVVGAGSVVTGQIPPNVIVAGNPAKVIRELT